jgi:signal transduction histidine kinase
VGQIYRLWPLYRTGLVEYDGRKVFLPAVCAEVLIALVFWSPPVARATGITPSVATLLIGFHVACMYVDGFPVYSLAQRHRWAFHLLVGTAMAYNLGISLAFVCVSHDPKTLLWTTVIIYAAVCGSLQEIEPNWAFLLSFVLGPLATIPWFLSIGAEPSWSIAGPLLMSGMSAIMYHLLAMHHSRWREERARMTRRIAELERGQLARDIHDGVGSALALVSLCGDALERHLANPDEARPILRTLQQAARDGVVDLREILNAIAPVSAPHLGGLRAALSGFGISVGLVSGVTVTVTSEGNDELVIASEARLALTRIFQEALSNTLRHGAAKTIIARLSAESSTVSLEVVDDGSGFRPDDSSTGRGLASMKARASDLGGTCEVTSRPGGGTRIHVRLPTEPARAVAPKIVNAQ